MKHLTILLIAIVTFSCTPTKLSKFYFLEGTWKVEGKKQYELWEKDGEVLKGEGYRIKDGQKQLYESLSIKSLDDRIVYQATVPNQNDGATITFHLNDTIKELFSFENLQHDFPKKIQYRKIDKNQMDVSVLGDEDKGFSFILKRVEN